MAFAQITEEFETDGDNGVRYLSSTVSDGADYFLTHDYSTQNPFTQQSDQTLRSVGNAADHSEVAWVMEDITDTNNPLGSTGPAVLRLNNIDVTGGSNLMVTLSVAAIFRSTPVCNDLFDTNDGLLVQYAFGANSGGTAGAPNPTLLNGTYTTIGQFMGTGVVSACSGLVGLDINMNGNGDDGTQLTKVLQDFAFNLPDPGGNTILSVQIVAQSLDGSEEFVFDNIRVTGSPLPVDLTSGTRHQHERKRRRRNPTDGPPGE